jgi:hypothetical protein
LDSYTMTDIPITTCACKLKCAKTGKTLIAFWNQYACQEQADGYGTGQSIHSVAQLEDFGLKVHDKITEGNTRIVHLDGYEFSMYVRGGLCYIQQKRCTVEEFGKYDHVLMTSDMGWNPETYDTKEQYDDSDDITVVTSNTDTLDESDTFSVSSDIDADEALEARQCQLRAYS